MKILLTGATGLIGGSVLSRLSQQHPEHDITALVRPETDPSRIAEIAEQAAIVKIDLGNVTQLIEYLDTNAFDYVYHIGALRGGRKFSRQEFYATNVLSTEMIIENCIKNKSTLIFCSSVGVFGAIPTELPANNLTQKIGDNYYHFTKIEAEKRINKAMLLGLKAAILRPSITYGEGDFGFPYQLVKMIKSHRLPLITKRIWIHLCHIDTITSAFVWLIENEFPNGLVLNVADREPVLFKDLVNFISRQLTNKNYPSVLQFDRRLFRAWEYVFWFLKDELWTSRVQLISRSWFYDVKELFETMDIPVHYTIPEFKFIIESIKK